MAALQLDVPQKFHGSECATAVAARSTVDNRDVTPIDWRLEFLDLLQERIEHLVVVFGGKKVRQEKHFESIFRTALDRV